MKTSSSQVVLAIFVFGFLVSSCAKRDNSQRDKLSAAQVSTPNNSQLRTLNQVAQNQATQVNVKVQWEQASMPTMDAQNNLTVSTAFSYNGKMFQVSTSHQVLSNTYVTPANPQEWDLKIDGMSVVTTAGCSDNQCSQYAILYNFRKNGQDVIQHLVWIDYSGQNYPRVHYLNPNNYWDLNTWYNFASNSNNFIDP